MIQRPFAMRKSVLGKYFSHMMEPRIFISALTLTQWVSVKFEVILTLY